MNIHDHHNNNKHLVNNYQPRLIQQQQHHSSIRPLNNYIPSLIKKQHNTSTSTNPVKLQKELFGKKPSTPDQNTLHHYSGAYSQNKMLTPSASTITNYTNMGKALLRPGTAPHKDKHKGNNSNNSGYGMRMSFNIQQQQPSYVNGIKRAPSPMINHPHNILSRSQKISNSHSHNHTKYRAPSPVIKSTTFI